MAREVLSRIPLVHQLRELFDGLVEVAYVDGLTKVITRNGFNAVVAALGVESYAAAYFDLNGFKSINERFGHEGGDAALAHFGTLLRSLTASDNKLMPFRMGGDEFLLLFPPDHATATLHSIAALGSCSFTIDDVPVEFGSSIGYALPNDVPIDEVVKRAELAARFAKLTSSPVPVGWSDSLDVEASEEFRRRCRACGLTLSAQVPKVSLRVDALSSCPNCSVTF